MDALIDVVPNAKHMNCVWRLYTNFKTNGKHTEKSLKDCLWKVIKSTTIKEFEDAMKDLSVDAYN